MKALIALGLVLAAFAGDAAADDYVAAAPGRLEGAGEVMRIGAGVTGIVRRVVVEEGDAVRAGDVLAELACEPMTHAVAVAVARASEAAAELARLRAGARAEEMKSAEADVGRARAVLQEADEEADRVGRLTMGRSVTEARRSSTVLQRAVRKAELEMAEQRLAQLGNGERAELILAAEARAAAADATVLQLRSELDFCTLRAPAASIVLRVNLTVGELVSTVAPRTLLELADVTAMRVVAEVDERDLGDICPGQGATVTADGFPEEALSAVVARMRPAMGRRSILSDDPAEKSDRDVREVVLRLTGQADWPLLLRVVVRFHPCDDAVASAVLRR